MSQNDNENPLLKKVYEEFGDQICLYSYLGAYYDGKNIYPCTEIIDKTHEWKVSWNIKETFQNSQTWIDLRKHYSKSSCHENEWCKVCSINEKNNFRSSRQAGNQLFTEIFPAELISTIKKIIANDFRSPNIIYFHWFPSNYCNYECIMCSGAASSKRLNFERKNQINDDIIPIAPYFSLRKDQVLEIIDDINGIGLTGGETILQPEVHKVIDYLIEIGRSHEVRINLLTNASEFPDDYVEKFKKFKEVIFSVSVDGTDDIIEYQRRGSNWKQVAANTIKIRDNFPMVINYVLTAVSVFSVVSFLNWARLNFFTHITFFPVKEPGEHLSLDAMPDNMRQNLLDELNLEKNNLDNDAQIYINLLDDVIRFLEQSSFDIYLHYKFKYMIKLEDTASKKSLTEIIPQWLPYFES